MLKFIIYITTIQFIKSQVLLKLSSTSNPFQQTSESSDYSLSLSTVPSSSYFHIQVNFNYISNSEQQPFFICSVNQQVYPLNSAQASSNYQDTQSYYLKRNFRYIIITPEGLSNASTLFCKVIIAQQSSVSYTITNSVSAHPICPMSCSGENGVCVNTKCVCASNYINVDCSVEAQQISLSQANTNVYQTETQYFLFLQPDQTVDQILTFYFSSKNQLTQTLYFVVEDENNLFAPSPSSYNYKLTLLSNSAPMKVTLDANVLKFSLTLQRVKRLLLGIYSSGQIVSAQITIQFQQSTGSTTNQVSLVILYSIVGFIGTCILIWLVIIIIKRFNRSEMQIENFDNSGLPSAQDNNLSHRRLRKQTQNITNFSQLMEKFLPIILPQFANKLRECPNEECMICLEVFQPDDECRLSPCNHFFHVKCFEEWLKKYENCPICRTELNVKTLKEMQDRTNQSKLHCSPMKSQQELDQSRMNMLVNDESQQNTDLVLNNL